jgi:DNA-binding MarR family transcriptional regulator
MTPTELLAALRPTLHVPVLTTRMIAVLALCAEAEKPINFAAATLNLKIAKPALSRCLDTLSERDEVERIWNYEQGNLADARKVFIGITPKGRQFLESMGIEA